MSNIERFPIEKLRDVSITAIQNAVAAALESLVGESCFSASIHNMKFDSALLRGRLKMDLTIECPDLVIADGTQFPQTDCRIVAATPDLF